MFNSVKFLVLMLVAINLASCSDTNNKPIIKFSGDGASIIIKNFDEASLLQVKKAYSLNPDSNNLISVWLLPGELDSLQDDLQVQGKYQLLADSIIFKPFEPFKKGKRYIVESFIGAQFGGVGKLMSGKANYNLQPQKEILKR